MTITIENDERELLERAARVLAEHARRDADGVKGTTVEQLHRAEQQRFLRFADRVKAVRSSPESAPPPNVTPFRQ